MTQIEYDEYKRKWYREKSDLVSDAMIRCSGGMETMDEGRNFYNE
jgi:hypothetical protein